MIKKIIVLGVAIIVMFSLAACGDAERHPNSDTSIETELEVQIRQDCVRQTQNLKLKNVWVHKYFGTFDESVVVHMRTTANLPPAMVVEKVAGFEFWTNTGERISVWKDGVFYSLSNSYDDGLLTADNVE